MEEGVSEKWQKYHILFEWPFSSLDDFQSKFIIIKMVRFLGENLVKFIYFDWNTTATLV